MRPGFGQAMHRNFRPTGGNVKAESRCREVEGSKDQGDFAQRNPKLLLRTSGVKKLRLKVGALKPQP